MENNSTTLEEPLLEKDVEKQPDNIAEDELDQPLLSSLEAGQQQQGGPSNNHLGPHHPENDDDDSSASFAFTLASELADMANLAWPLAVSFFCRMGMASTDSAFVGHIPGSPETYLAAAVLSDLVVNCLITPPLAFNQVLNALVAQAIGSGNPKTAGIWLQQSMFWLSTTMLPCLIGFFYVEYFLMLLGFPQDIAALAGKYAKFNILWPIPNGLYQCMRFYFQAQGLPRPAMYNNILFLFVNALLNYIFVFAFKLGFIGAAISLSVSRTLQPVVYFYYMFVWKQHHTRTWPGIALAHHTWDRTVEFLKQALPNVGTLIFQQVASQAITVLVGKLGQEAIAVSSALSTIATPLSGTVSATSWTVSSVRVGFHLGRGDFTAARKSAELVLLCITVVTLLAGSACWYFRFNVLEIATNDEPLIEASVKLIPAMLTGTYLSLIVGNITSGVFSGMGRPMLATILSFGFELPLSIIGVAVYILKFKGTLTGVYWLQAGLSFLETIVVAVILMSSDWSKCAEEAQRRQESNEDDEIQASPDEEEQSPLIGESDTNVAVDSMADVVPDEPRKSDEVNGDA